MKVKLNCQIHSCQYMTMSQAIHSCQQVILWAKTVTQLPTDERVPIMQEGQYLTGVLMPFYM